MTDPRDVFPDALVEALILRNISPRDFATLIDVTPGTVYDWTAGITFPCPRHFERCLVVLDKTREEMLCPS